MSEKQSPGPTWEITPPKAWNVQEIGSQDTLPGKESFSSIEVHRADSQKAYRKTGKKQPVALIYADGKLVGTLTRRDIDQIVVFWDETNA